MDCKVTFIVIAFNETRGIIECLESIIRQKSDCNFLITLIDDGSTDGTADLVERTFFGKVNIVRQNNLGRGAARLAGILATNTEYIAMVDADIRLPVNWLSRCLDEIGANQGVGGIAVPDGDCSTIHRIFNIEPRVMPGSISLTGNNSFFRTKLLQEIGTEWATRLGEDFRLQRALDQKGHQTSRIEGLVVEHKEYKSIVETIGWFFDSGKDATKLWLAFKITRMPDLGFLVFLSLLLATPFLFLVFGPATLFLLAVFLLLIGLAHLFSKFKMNKKPLHLFTAWITNSILMSSYLVGRTVGLFLRETNKG